MNTCGAKNRQGNPCARRPIPGGTRCKLHGGGSPNAKAAARRRLLEAVDPILTVMLDLAYNDPDSRVRLAACRDILDRVGLNEPRQVEVITLDAVEAEIRRLEAELADNDPATADAD
jgi:hypothetical protein